jgi:hypothetical protein
MGMKKWEYDTVVLSGDTYEPVIRKRLDEHGAEGWELVAVTRAPDLKVRFYFKREVASGEE